ncbi:hypothetical protein Tco_0085815 [Tanacetum coccineum]
MVNVIPSDHVDDLPVVEPNQNDDVPVIPEPVLVDEDEDPKEEEFEEEEEPQKEEDDMEVDIEEDENEPELTYPYEEVDPLNPLSPAFELEPEDVMSEATDSDRRKKAKDEYYGKLILDLVNEVRSSVEEGTTAMENLNKRVKRDLYWTRVRAHEFYLEMIRRGFVFEERPNEAIDVPVEDEKNPSSESRYVIRFSLYYDINEYPVCFFVTVTESMRSKSASLTQAAVRRMIKESVDAAIAVERERHANTGNDARGSGPVRG